MIFQKTLLIILSSFLMALHAESKEACSIPTAEVADSKSPKLVTAKELEDTLANQSGWILVDARTGKYDDGIRITGAQKKSVAHDTPEAELAVIFPDKNQMIICYCHGGECPASMWLAKRLISLGYTNVIDYPGGIDEWQKLNKPVEPGIK